MPVLPSGQNPRRDQYDLVVVEWLSLCLRSVSKSFQRFVIFRNGRSRDVGSTDFDECSSDALLRRTPNCKSYIIKDAQETPRNPWEH